LSGVVKRMVLRGCALGCVRDPKLVRCHFMCNSGLVLVSRTGDDFIVRFLLRCCCEFEVVYLCRQQDGGHGG